MDRVASLRNSPRRLLLLLGLIVVAAGALWGAHAWRQRHPPVDDAPPGLASPYLNTRAGVKYVGSSRCAECHVKEASTYAEHPMGRSSSPPDHWLPAQRGAASSFEAAGLRYAVERRPGGVWHREFLAVEDRVAAEVTAEVAFTVGSGRQGQSFLVNREGSLYLSPISWFAHKKAWGLSPGFETVNQHFDRPVIEACLFCHTNAAHTEPDTINHYRPAGLRPESIGCERCHGPGELHVAARPGGRDFTIVNPRRLEAPLREAVCQQCHLQGETRVVRRGRSLYDYRPGLPLDEFVSVFVRPQGRGDGRKAVSHVEQMYQSRCFRASDGKLGCISCHDPHVLPAAGERVAWYRGRCLSCHGPAGRRPADERHQDAKADCIACHMPRGDSSNIAHTSVTDHRIVRRPTPATPDDEGEDFALEPFYREGPRSGPLAAERDLGLALIEVAERPFPEPVRRGLVTRGRRLLAGAVETVPDDVPALEWLGVAWLKEKRPRQALAALEKALERAPRREWALKKAALAAMELADYERAAGYWRRLRAVNPADWEGHGFLAQVLALRGQFAAAADTSRAALRLNPFEPRTRMLLIDCLIHTGDKKQARAEFDTLLSLRPPQAERLRPWFDNLMRSVK